VITPTCTSAGSERRRTSSDPDSLAPRLGTANPDGFPVSDCHFQSGTTLNYEATARCTPHVGGGTSAVSVSSTLNGLSPATIYRYRLVPTDAGNTITTADQTVATGCMNVAPKPPVIPPPPPCRSQRAKALCPGPHGSRLRASQAQ
jgi:hypothetical protein